MDLVSLPSALTPMDIRRRTTHSTSLSSDLHHLYKIPKTSRSFEPALGRFLGNAELESFVGSLHDVELEEFIDFLDEVRRFAYRPSYCFDRSIRYCSLRA